MKTSKTDLLPALTHHNIQYSSPAERLVTYIGNNLVNIVKSSSMAFPKKKTDWSTREQSQEDDAPVTNSENISGDSISFDRASRTRKGDFFKVISAGELDASQKAAYSRRGGSITQSKEGIRAPMLAVPQLGVLLLGMLSALSKGSLAKKIPGTEAPILMQLKQLLTRKQRLPDNTPDTPNSTNPEFSATPHYSNVTRSVKGEHDTSSNSSRNFSSINVPTKRDTLTPERREQIKQEDPVVRCPSCQTRFYVDADVLAKYQMSGRKPQFHCSKCDHVFSSAITAFSSSISALPQDTSDLELDGIDQRGEIPTANGDSCVNAVKISSVSSDTTKSKDLELAGDIHQRRLDHQLNDEDLPTWITNQSSQDTYTNPEARQQNDNSTLSAPSSSPTTPAYPLSGSAYPDDDEPLETHFDDEVKPQSTPWEVKRSTSDGSLRRNSSFNSSLSSKLGETTSVNSTGEDTHYAPDSSTISSGNSQIALIPGSKKIRSKHQKNPPRRGLGDSLSIWSLAKRVFSPVGGRKNGTKERGPTDISAVHPYLSSSQRKPTSAPIESANSETDQLPLSLRPSKPTSWQILSAMLYGGRRERWVETALLGTPLLVTVILLAVFSYCIRFSLPAYELMATNLGLKRSEIAPVGLTVHDASFKSIVLESGETVHTISGRVVNSTDRSFKEISVEGLTFNAQGQLISTSSAVLGNALNIAKLKALPLEDILSLQQKKRDISSILKPGQSERFIIALSERNLSTIGHASSNTASTTLSWPLRDRHQSSLSTGDSSAGPTIAETEFFSARVYLVK